MSPKSEKPTSCFDSSIDKYKKIKSGFYFGQKENHADYVATDVSFNVEGKKYMAHKCVLAASSVVFEAMLFGHFEDSKITNPEVHIADIQPSIFEMLLNIIYYDLHKLREARMTMDEALDVYYAIHKYNLPQENNFIGLIQRNLNTENVLSVLPHAEFYDWKFIRSKCWSIIEREAKKVVESDDFVRISWDFLHLILENNRLKISEFDLYRGVMRWAKHERNVKRNQSMIDILGVAVYKLRFPLMSKYEFVIAELSGILRSGEIMDLKSNFLNNTTYSHNPRKNVCHCRQKKLLCSLCTLPSLMSVDGRGLIKYKLSDFLTKAGSNKIEIYGNNFIKCYMTNILMCECVKYESCPAFPNGRTVQVLNDMNQKFTSGNLKLTIQMMH